MQGQVPWGGLRRGDGRGPGCPGDALFKGKDHLPALVLDTEASAPLEPCLCLFGLQEPDETALHLAVRSVDRTSLHIVDFLVQNRWVFCDQGGPWIVFLGVSEEGARGLVAAVVWPGCWGLRRCADAFPDRRRLPGVGGARVGSPSRPGV